MYRMAQLLTLKNWNCVVELCFEQSFSRIAIVSVSLCGSVHPVPR